MGSGCSDNLDVADFAALADEVLELLAGQVGLRLWLVTRVVDGGQVVLLSRHGPDGDYGLSPGSVLDWAASLCFQMVAGPGPRVAPRVEDVEQYARAAATAPAPVAAYVGVPLMPSMTASCSGRCAASTRKSSRMRCGRRSRWSGCRPDCCPPFSRVNLMLKDNNGGRSAPKPKRRRMR